MNDIRSLHQRFGQTSKEKLAQLLKGVVKRGITKETGRQIEKVRDGCDQCHTNKKQENRNKLIIYRSGDFKESVAIDLTEKQ